MKATRFFVLVLVLGLLVTLSGAAGAQGQPGEGGASAPALSNGGCVAGDTYDPACDVNRDDDTDIVDLELVANHWGQEGVWTADGDFWSLTGNAGTDPATQFLGTTDNVTLTLAVSNTIALHIEPTTDTPNLIGGYSGNSVSVGAVGATISGGGEGGFTNQVTADYATVGGGAGNKATADYATVAGGRQGGASGNYATVAGGSGNYASGNYATVGGGGPADPSDPYPIWPDGNVASGDYATVGGGAGNQATADYATIAGGGKFTSEPIPLSADLNNSTGNRVTDEYGTVGGGGNNQAGNANANTADAGFATVSGGAGNTASSWLSTVGGGESNTASSTAATVGGGWDNTASTPYATVSGGRDNFATGDSAIVAGGQSNQASGDYTAVGGGSSNGSSGDYATIGGGVINYVTDDYGTVGGGWNNRAGDTSGTRSDAIAATVGGGRDNQAGAYYSTVSGGRTNEATGWYSVIAGGNNNSTTRYGATVSGGHNNNATEQYATVCGGLDNTASGYESFVCGGSLNSASGEGAVALGGHGNNASGKHSFAAGFQAQAKHTGSFVWADAASDKAIASTGDSQFVARASGGVWFWADGAASTGVVLPAGAGSWANQSDRDAKTDFAAVDGMDVVKRLAEMPIETWSYKTQDAAIRHIGPSAQDFYAAFGVGEDDRHISTVDADGVALAAIQGLYQIVQEKDAQITAQQEQIDALQKQNADLEARLVALEQLVQELSKK